MRPQISVIIPVYKAEKYLRNCLDSVLKQDFHDIEIILVASDSGDKSVSICKEYAAKDNRLKLIVTRPEGTSAARNTGLDAAMGKYITFVDSDDRILPRMYSSMHGFCEENSLDIGICAAYRNGANEIWVKGKPVILRYPEARLYDFMLTWNIAGRNSALWNKLYRRELIKNSRFTQEVFFDDSIFNCSCFGKANAAGALEGAYYVYINRADSLLHFSDSEKVRRHAREYWSLLSVVTEGRERQDEIFAYSAVRLLASAIYNLKLSGYTVEEYCTILCGMIKEMKLEAYLTLAQEPRAFEDYVKTFGISGGEAESYFDFICSLNKGYDAIVARQGRYKNEFGQVRT